MMQYIRLPSRGLTVHTPCSGQNVKMHYLHWTVDGHVAQCLQCTYHTVHQPLCHVSTICAAPPSMFAKEPQL